MDAIIERARAGDAQAFEELYRQTAGRVHALCLRLTGDAQRARERMQDVYVRVWEQLDSFRGDSAFTTWLHTVTVNVCLAQRRAAGRRGQHETAVEDEVLETLSGGTSQMDPTDRIALERAVAALPEGARTVLVLHEIHGYTHEEIAEMTDTRPGTSKAQLFKARQRLRELLQ